MGVIVNRPKQRNGRPRAARGPKSPPGRGSHLLRRAGCRSAHGRSRRPVAGRHCRPAGRILLGEQEECPLRYSRTQLALQTCCGLRGMGAKATGVRSRDRRLAWFPARRSRHSRAAGTSGTSFARGQRDPVANHVPYQGNSRRPDTELNIAVERRRRQRRRDYGRTCLSPGGGWSLACGAAGPRAPWTAAFCPPRSTTTFSPSMATFLAVDASFGMALA